MTARSRDRRSRGDIAPSTATPLAGFANSQIKKLVGSLDPAHVRVREVEGRRLNYIEGWFAVAQANAIFGYAGWDRQMVQFEKAFERKDGTTAGCGYLARVRITVRAGTTTIIREGTGYGQAFAKTIGDAQERALKSAETDATKRALTTFGNRFGLSLYDKEWLPDNAATGAEPHARTRSNLSLLGAVGEVLAANLSPEGFCTGLRQLIDAARDIIQLDGVVAHNRAGLALLRQHSPNLVSRQNEHYADIAERLAAKRRAKLVDSVPLALAAEPVIASASAEVTPGDAGLAQGAALAETTAPPEIGLESVEISTLIAGELADAAGRTMPAVEPASREAVPSGREEVEIAAAQPNAGNQTTPMVGRLPWNGNASRLAAGIAIDKSQLAVATTRRLRSKAHLLFVASKPCLICGELPSHAHHITFAQARGLSVKVSDEFTVPLCPLHHNQCHAHGNERAFWRSHRIEPLQAALALWSATLGDEHER